MRANSELPPADTIRRRLEADGLIEQVQGRARTTRTWQDAMARAVAKLAQRGDEGYDLRIPIAWALIEHYSGNLPDETLVAMVGVMTPIEAAELDPISATTLAEHGDSTTARDAHA